MNFRDLMTAHSVMAVPMGIACLLAPVAMLANYGLTLSSMGLVIYQFWGVALSGLGMLTWVLRTADESRLKRGSSLALVIIYCTNSAVAVRGQSAGANDFGWSTVALFVGLALALSYIRFVKLPNEEAV